MNDMKRATVGPTAGPVVTGPGTIQKTKAGKVYRVDVYQGTHSSVRIAGVGDAPITSNNPNVVSSLDAENWIVGPSSAQGREVFFYAKVSFDRTHGTTLFLLDEGKPGSRAVFQVRSLPLPPNDQRTKGRLFLKLNGGAMALNQLDFDARTRELTVVPYHLGTLDIDVNNDERLSNVFARVLAAAEAGKIKHLVINAHGTVDHATGNATVHLGDHITIDTARGLFTPLQNKVEYIWFQNCHVGTDRALFSRISEITRAWIAVPADVGIGSVPVPNGKIDLAHGPYIFFKKSLGGDSPVGKEEFFKGARVGTGTDLDQNVAFLIDGPPR